MSRPLSLKTFFSLLRRLMKTNRDTEPQRKSAVRQRYEKSGLRAWVNIWRFSTQTQLQHSSSLWPGPHKAETTAFVPQKQTNNIYIYIYSIWRLDIGCYINWYDFYYLFNSLIIGGGGIILVPQSNNPDDQTQTHGSTIDFYCEILEGWEWFSLCKHSRRDGWQTCLATYCKYLCHNTPPLPPTTPTLTGQQQWQVRF